MAVALWEVAAIVVAVAAAFRLGVARGRRLRRERFMIHDR